jgi:hypothetical protein
MLLSTVSSAVNSTAILIALFRYDQAFPISLGFSILMIKGIKIMDAFAGNTLSVPLKHTNNCVDAWASEFFV